MYEVHTPQIIVNIKIMRYIIQTRARVVSLQILKRIHVKRLVVASKLIERRYSSHRHATNFIKVLSRFNDRTGEYSRS